MSSVLITFFLADFAKDLSPQSIISLTQLKTNFILGLSSKQTSLTSLANEFSLIPPPPGTPLVSYFPKRDEPPSVIPITPLSLDRNNKILSKDLAPVWFSGVPHALGSNPLLVPILHAPTESFGSEVDGGTADAVVDAAERGGEGLWAGSQLGVVTGFQTSDGARVTWVGGVDVFSDEYIQKEISKLVWFLLICVIYLSLISLEASSLEMPNLRGTLWHGLSKRTSYYASITLNITK